MYPVDAHGFHQHGGEAHGVEETDTESAHSTRGRGCGEHESEVQEVHKGDPDEEEAAQGTRGPQDDRVFELEEEEHHGDHGQDDTQGADGDDQDTPDGLVGMEGQGCPGGVQFGAGGYQTMPADSRALRIKKLPFAFFVIHPD